MGDSGHVVSIRLTRTMVADLDRVVQLELGHARRRGHRVTRSDLARLAVEAFIRQKLRRVSRETATDTPA